MEKTFGDTNIYLIGHDGKRLAKIEMNMLNAEKVVPYFEMYNASAIRTEDGWIHPKPIRINTYGEELIVKPNYTSFTLTSVIVILWTAMTIWGIYGAWTEKSLGLFILMMAIPIPLMFFLFKDVRRELRIRRNMCLILTTDICTYIDEKGNKKEFLFDEIKCVHKKQEKGIKNSDIRNYFEIVLTSGEVAAKIIHSISIDNSTEIKDFVEYHKKR